MAHQLRGQKTREAILEAALSIIGAQGTAAVTHRAVAERAGIAVGAITYYFSSTSGLLEEALRLASEQERERFLALAPADPADAAGWISGLVDELYIASEADREQKLAAFELMLGTARQPRLRDAFAELQQDHLRMAEPALAAVGAEDPASDARLLTAALLGLDLVQLTIGGLPRAAVEVTVTEFVHRFVVK